MKEVSSGSHPLDPLLLVLHAALKLRSVRGMILVFGLIPAILYALPAQPCGCLPTPFMRCRRTWPARRRLLDDAEPGEVVCTF
jgi:hypothetical protein